MLTGLQGQQLCALLTAVISVVIGDRPGDGGPRVGSAELTVEDVDLLHLVPEEVGALEVNRPLAVVADDVLVVGEVRLAADAGGHDWCRVVLCTNVSDDDNWGVGPGTSLATADATDDGDGDDRGDEGGASTYQHSIIYQIIIIIILTSASFRPSQSFSGAPLLWCRTGALLLHKKCCHCCTSITGTSITK